MRAALCRRSSSSSCRCTVLTDNQGISLNSSTGFVVKGYISDVQLMFMSKDTLPLPPNNEWDKVAENRQIVMVFLNYLN